MPPDARSIRPPAEGAPCPKQIRSRLWVTAPTEEERVRIIKIAEYVFIEEDEARRCRRPHHAHHHRPQDVRCVEHRGVSAVPRNSSLGVLHPSSYTGLSQTFAHPTA